MHQDEHLSHGGSSSDGLGHHLLASVDSGSGFDATVGLSASVQLLLSIGPVTMATCAVVTAVTVVPVISVVPVVPVVAVSEAVEDRSVLVFTELADQLGLQSCR